MPSKEAQGHFEEEARGYFEFLARVGLTKHLGSMEATRRLVEMSRIRSGQYVLEMGCGVGATVTYLAKSIGCRVVGLDVVEEMIRQSRERARAERVGARVAFTVADARKLPLEGALRRLFTFRDGEWMKRALRMTGEYPWFRSRGRDDFAGRVRFFREW